MFGERASGPRPLLLAVLLPLAFGLLCCRRYLVDGALYWDHPALYSTFHDTLASMNRFGEPAWWGPRHQMGFPTYYFTWLGTDSGSAPYILLALFVWILGRLGVVFESFFPVFLGYQFVLMPIAYDLSVVCLAKQMLRSPRAIAFAAILGAFSPAVVNNFSDTGLEQVSYANLWAAALLFLLRRPTRFRFRVLVLASCAFALAFKHPTLYWSALFVPMFAALVPFVPRLRRGGAQLLRQVPLREALAGVVAVVLCLAPTLIVFSHGTDIVRSTVGTRTYEYERLMPGNPAQVLTMSVPGVMYEWNADGWDKALEVRPMGSEWHGLYGYLGVLALPLVFVGLAYARSRWRYPLFALLAAGALVILLSTQSAAFSLLLVWPSPLRAVNHFGDHPFGITTVALLTAALGFQTILRRADRLRIPLTKLFLASSAGSLALAAYVYGDAARHAFLLGFGLAIAFFTAVALQLLVAAPSPVAATAAVRALLLLAAIDVSTLAFAHVRLHAWQHLERMTFGSRADGIGPEDGRLSWYANTVLELLPMRRLRESGFDAQSLPGLAVYAADAVLETSAVPSPRPATIQTIAFTYNSLRLRVTSPATGRLLWRDAAFPFWRATVNGAAVPIDRAFGAFKAVTVPAGASEVAFRFSPGLLPWAIAIAASIVFGLAGYVVTEAWRTREKRQAGADQLRLATTTRSIA
jgi:hypothetical protein